MLLGSRTRALSAPASRGGAVLSFLLGDGLVRSCEVVMSSFGAGSCGALGGVALASELRASGAAAPLEPASPECGNGIEEHR